jgi:hypothetical protein
VLRLEQVTDLVRSLAVEGVRVSSIRPRAGEVSVEAEGCDGTPRHSMEWADRVLEDGDLGAWLEARGLPCDCSVLEWFVDQSWRRRSSDLSLRADAE